MELHEREYYLYKILSGLHHVSVEGRFFVIKTPTVLDRYEAAKIYKDILNLNEGLYTNETIEEFLCLNGYWSATLAARLKSLEKEIENTLVVMYEGRNNKSILNRNRTKLAEHREERGVLYEKRHSFDHLTLEHIALSAKLKFLIGCSLYENDIKYWSSYKQWNDADRILDRVIVQLNREFVPYDVYRELARTEPWRGIWVSKKSGSPIFDGPATNLTEGQQLLVSWTVRIENLYQHSNCPSESVVEDNDLLDGWYIMEARKQKEEKMEGVLGKITNEAIANSDEVYIVADTIDERDEIRDLNSAYSRSIQKRRHIELNAVGEMKETDFFDVKQRAQMELNKVVHNGR